MAGRKTGRRGSPALALCAVAIGAAVAAKAVGQETPPAGQDEQPAQEEEQERVVLPGEETCNSSIADALNPIPEEVLAGTVESSDAAAADMVKRFKELTEQMLARLGAPEGGLPGADASEESLKDLLDKAGTMKPEELLNALMKDAQNVDLTCVDSEAARKLASGDLVGAMSSAIDELAEQRLAMEEELRRLGEEWTDDTLGTSIGEEAGRELEELARGADGEGASEADFALGESFDDMAMRFGSHAGEFEGQNSRGSIRITNGKGRIACTVKGTSRGTPFKGRCKDGTIDEQGNLSSVVEGTGFMGRIEGQLETVHGSGTFSGFPGGSSGGWEVIK